MKESNSENKKEIFIDKIKSIPLSILSQETLKSWAKASNLLKLNQDKEGNMSILGIPVVSLGGDKIQVHDNIYELTPEIHKEISLTTYMGKSMKNENDQKTLCISLVYVGYTGDGDRKSN